MGVKLTERRYDFAIGGARKGLKGGAQHPVKVTIRENGLGSTNHKNATATAIPLHMNGGAQCNKLHP